MKKALITGGTGYVGTAVANMLRVHEFEVINISRSMCNLTDPVSLTHIVEELLKNWGAPDVIIHMACPPTTRKALEDVSDKERTQEFAITVGVAEILANTFLPHMKTGSSFIGITTASLDKETPEKNIGAYIPAKAALRKLLKKLQIEWEGKGVHVYEVAPTFLPGGLNKDLPEGVRNLLARQKDGTVPTAESVAKTIETLIQG